MAAVRVIGVLMVVFASTASAQFSRPVECDDCIANWFYFDNNGPEAGRLDWNCDTSSYDGHRGTDFSLAGGLGAIDAGHAVVAVAEGVVERAQDGFFDRCTSCGGAMCGTDFGFGYGNHVVINHGEFKVVYAHMRTGSVRVGVGDTVRCGQSVGDIASSGCSNGAHLHFETRPLGAPSARAFDPFQGGCGGTESLWFVQGPHRGMPEVMCTAPTSCPPMTSSQWTCSTDARERVRCVDGEVFRESCLSGCVSTPEGEDDVCATCEGAPTWQCDGDARVRCVDAGLERELCPLGCDASAPEAICLIDNDGDGFTDVVDCDDTSASVFPGAPDPCGDGVDANCDGNDACEGEDAGVRDGGPPTTREALGTVNCAAGGSGTSAGTLVALLLLRRRIR
ncbi:MAG: peptidoglycan DD-metalloendopeptidase family protein [Myxococcota bacterium]